MTKILVVEDDERISRALNIRLSFDGYEIVSAFDAIAALTMLKENQFDLVLLDISIPGGNGFEVISRAKKICGKVPAFFVITAHKDYGLREKAMALGAVGFFEKPFDGSELQTAIYRWLTTS